LRLSEINWLADENVQFPVIHFLRRIGWKVESVKEMGWDSKSDVEILNFSVQNNLGILTQDIDFGELVFKSKMEFVSILRFWPGHFNSDLIITNLESFIFQDFEVRIPFFVTVEIRENSSSVGIRIRQF
jgi:predicted nuclease of predicted toxin-antitoxin system